MTNLHRGPICRDCGGPAFVLNGQTKGVMRTYHRYPLPSTCLAWREMDEDERDAAALDALRMNDAHPPSVDLCVLNECNCSILTVASTLLPAGIGNRPRADPGRGQWRRLHPAAQRIGVGRKPGEGPDVWTPSSISLRATQPPV